MQFLLNLAISNWVQISPVVLPHSGGYSYWYNCTCSCNMFVTVRSGVPFLLLSSNKSSTAPFDPFGPCSLLLDYQREQNELKLSHNVSQHGSFSISFVSFTAWWSSWQRARQFWKVLWRHVGVNTHHTHTMVQLFFATIENKPYPQRETFRLLRNVRITGDELLLWSMSDVLLKGSVIWTKNRKMTS